MTSTADDPPRPDAVLDQRAVEALVDADPVVADGWVRVQTVAWTDPPSCGLAAGDRPSADVEVLAGTGGRG